MIPKFLIIICVLVLLIIIYNNYTCINEQFTKSTKSTDEATNKSIGDVDFDDVYSSAILYENEGMTLDSRLGIDICLEKCKGNCVEYGVTGSAFCFE